MKCDKTLIRILCFLLVANVAFAEQQPLPKPFPSTVKGLEDITNSHIISGKETSGQVIRGASPEGQVDKLLGYGITHVLIFKNQLTNKTDVTDEIAELKSRGHFSDAQVKQIPFLWRKLPADSSACEQVIEGLAFLRHASQQPGAKVFFHCTVGEDRTGLLAGLYRMAFQGLPLEEAFGEETQSAEGAELKSGEMCSRGYEAGNPLKKLEVAQTIQNELTPVFIRVAFFIESGLLRTEQFDKMLGEFNSEKNQEILRDLKSLCRLSPSPYPFFEKGGDSSKEHRLFSRYNPKNYRCR